MSTLMENLTPAEAAVVSGVSLRDVHRMIDEHILPDRLFDTSESRSFKRQACVFISFYVGSADKLTSDERQKSIELASRIADWPKAKQVVEDGFLTIDFASFSNGVHERLERLEAARDLVVSDPEILSGTPVVRGTRVPIYQIAAAAAAGTSIDKILLAYPSVNREQIELAILYAEATPQRGRPRQVSTVPPRAKIIKSRRKSIRQTA